MANQKFKTKIQADAGLKLSTGTASRALTTDSNGDLASSTVTTTELAHLSGIDSNIQDQLDAKASQTALDNHINDTTGAHAASAISVTPAGNLAADDVQEAVEELQSDIDTRALDSAVIKKDGSVAFTANQSLGGFKLTNVAAPTANGEVLIYNQLGAANGVATLDGSGKVPVSQLPNAIMEYQGVWDADTNSPSLADGAGNADSDIGNVYRVSVAGTQDLGSGNITFAVGDYVILNSSKVWEKADTTDAVSSVFGRTGAVTAQSGDYTATQITNTPAGNIAATTVQAAINELDSEKFASADFNSSFDTRLATKSTTDLAEGSNLYFTDERAQDAVGNILVDSSTIDFTYLDGTPSITASVIASAVDHDQLLNFVANEHIDHSAVTISGASNGGLSGGGDITASRTLSVDITNATAETSADNADLILIHDNSASALRKMTRANFLSGISLSSPGDINETSFSLANNQAAAANVTGLAFANATVRSFVAQVAVIIDATADLYESFELKGIQKGSSWDLSVSSVGDDSLITFSITNAGQVQYTSADYAGFSAGTMKFRAQTLSL